MIIDPDRPDVHIQKGSFDLIALDWFRGAVSRGDLASAKQALRSLPKVAHDVGLKIRHEALLESAMRNTLGMTRFIYDESQSAHTYCDWNQIVRQAFITACRNEAADIVDFYLRELSLAAEIVAWGLYRAEDETVRDKINSYIVEYYSGIGARIHDAYRAQMRFLEAAMQGRADDLRQQIPGLKHNSCSFVYHEALLKAIEGGHRNCVSLLLPYASQQYWPRLAGTAGARGLTDIVADIAEAAGQVHYRQRFNNISFVEDTRSKDLVRSVLASAVSGAARRGDLETVQSIVETNGGEDAPFLVQQAALAAIPVDQDRILAWALPLVPDMVVSECFNLSIKSQSGRCERFLYERRGPSCINAATIELVVRRHDQERFDLFSAAGSSSEYFDKALKNLCTDIQKREFRIDLWAADRLWDHAAEDTRSNALAALAYAGAGDTVEHILSSKDNISSAALYRALMAAASQEKHQSFDAVLERMLPGDRHIALRGLVEHSSNKSYRLFIPRLLDVVPDSDPAVLIDAVQLIAAREISEGDDPLQDSVIGNILAHSAFPSALMDDVLAKLSRKNNLPAIQAAIAYGGNPAIPEFYNAVRNGDQRKIAELAQEIPDRFLQETMESEISDAHFSIAQIIIMQRPESLDFREALSMFFRHEAYDLAADLMLHYNAAPDESHFKHAIGAGDHHAIDVLLLNQNGVQAGLKYLEKNPPQPQEGRFGSIIITLGNQARSYLEEAIRKRLSPPPFPLSRTEMPVDQPPSP